MGAVLVIAARPEAVKQGFFGLAAARANPLVRIRGGTLGPPNVVSDDVREGLGFCDGAGGEEATPNGLDPGEVGGVTVP